MFFQAVKWIGRLDNPKTQQVATLTITQTRAGFTWNVHVARLGQAFQVRFRRGLCKQWNDAERKSKEAAKKGIGLE